MSWGTVDPLLSFSSYFGSLSPQRRSTMEFPGRSLRGVDGDLWRLPKTVYLSLKWHDLILGVMIHLFTHGCRKVLLGKSSVLLSVVL